MLAPSKATVTVACFAVPGVYARESVPAAEAVAGPALVPDACTIENVPAVPSSRSRRSDATSEPSD
ncbi:hypothetical protein D3C81_2185580 [compost metagenome]